MSSNENPKRKMLVEKPIKVQSYDIDYMKIVNNTVYVRWFEDLRMQMLDEYFPYEEMLKDNNSPILHETYVKYKRPIRINNKPIGRVWMEELKASRWVVRFEIVEDEVVFCEGKQVGYLFNMERNRPVRFPDQFMAYYNSL